jgi:hypothetical protein
MAQSLSLQMTSPRYPVSGPGMGGRSIKTERGEFNLAAALPVADTVLMFRLHRNFRVIGGHVKGSLGTGVTISVGDAGVADRYFAAGTVAATGTVVSSLNPAGFDYLTPTFTDVIVTLAGATTAATGKLVVVLTGYIEEPA